MRNKTYVKIINFISKDEQLTNCIYLTNKFITTAIYIAYPALLVLQVFLGLVQNNSHFNTAIQAFCVPAVSFVLVSVLRNLINAPRPYEVLDIKPAISKETKGKSFPSRHAFSIFIIGVTFCACCPKPAIGWIVLALGVCLAILRVLAGVHFVRDVVVGAMLGVACGIIGFWVL